MNKDVKTIVKGETLLIAVKGVNGGKVQLEFAEIISNPYNKARANNLVSMLNKSDDRFGSSARRAWITGQPGDISELLGLDVSSIEYGASKELNVLNPEIGGERLRVQVTETITPDAYQEANLEKSAKKAGSEGDFILHEGDHIFSNSEVVTGEPYHTFLKPDTYEAPVSEDTAVTADIQA